MIVYITLASGENETSEDLFSCCTSGYCVIFLKCSGQVLKVTTNVDLSSVASVSGVENVGIIGYNNPTVDCYGIGEVKLLFK